MCNYTQLLEPDRAEQVLQRFLRASSMNPKGFRQSSKKNGPVRTLTFPDLLMITVVGMSALPRAQQSTRKEAKGVRRILYLDKVRNNPTYPKGDPRGR